MTLIRLLLIGVGISVLALVCVAALVVFLSAQEQTPIQTDFKDMTTRKKIDWVLFKEIKNVNKQTQADTLQLTAGQVKDTVYLDNKYEDMGFIILLNKRIAQGVDSLYAVIPLSDSSFEITKGSSDTSWVQFITIHK